VNKRATDKNSKTAETEVPQ